MTLPPPGIGYKDEGQRNAILASAVAVELSARNSRIQSFGPFYKVIESGVIGRRVISVDQWGQVLRFRP